MTQSSRTVLPAFTLLILVSVLVHGLLARMDAGAESRVQLPGTVESDLGQARSLSNAFKEVARTLQPAVVSIQSYRRRGGSEEVPSIRRSPFSRSGYYRAEFGSGVLAKEGGYIITNNHVIKDAHSIEVELHDGTKHYAEIIGGDSKFDIAVLRIEVEGLKTAYLGDSDTIEVGDWALAIGNPYRLDQTVTVGIISAIGRNQQNVAEFEDFIQTDAAINPGNSGGPLVNLDGEVVGINTAISSRRGYGVGIGFAIPINLAKRVLEAMVSGKHGERPAFLGVNIDELTPDVAEEKNFSGENGVVITSLQENYPADKAGLQVGDILLAIDEQPIRRVTQLQTSIATIAPGTRVDVVVFRDGKVMSIPVTLATRPRTE